MTKVIVYRVGQFGAFKQKRLTLRPGSYTAVGSRAGFRDVRIRFRVDPAETETIEIDAMEAAEVQAEPVEV